MKKVILLTIPLLCVWVLSYSQSKVIIEGSYSIKEKENIESKTLLNINGRNQIELWDVTSSRFGQEVYYKVKFKEVTGYIKKKSVDEGIVEHVRQNNTVEEQPKKSNQDNLNIQPPENFNSILSYSSKYYFNGTNYIPDYATYSPSSNPYAVLQGRYDAGFRTIQSEYQKLIGLELLNLKNNSWLKSEKNRIKNIVATWKNIDWSKPENVNSSLSILNKYLENQQIKNEIILLQKISINYSRIRGNDQEGFYKTERWKELVGLMNEVKNCSSCNFIQLGYKYNIY
ncbi:hypothetical protein [Algoriphagus aquimarinus]|uniref:Uncharacterized protein n=1 Tax=Algoriphagus aquimarinus TaxID=237018 RepID=A0A1I0Y220_9BACT|nr:hypothetical protein [Algoriphagus aquimarinus]SFB07214.1 hypothetical protein SAMN04489723_10466 [Algoriphagus aquimarinus]